MFLDGEGLTEVVVTARLPGEEEASLRQAGPGRHSLVFIVCNLSTLLLAI